jgi:hypothetical protein
MSSTSTKRLDAVWSSSATNAWAVGETIQHFDGTAWTEMQNPAGRELLGIWGDDPADVWAVGAYGTILNTNYDPPIRTYNCPRMERS